MTTTPISRTPAPAQRRVRGFVARHPIAVLLIAATAFVWTTQTASLVAGADLMPAKIGELLVLLGAATWIAHCCNGTAGVRQLFAGLGKWRMGIRVPVRVTAIPILTVAVAVVTGTLHPSGDGWAAVALTYLAFLVLGAATGNLWEETVWAGFVQGRLLATRGLLVGSLLTAVPVFLVHLPLAFEADGLAGTSWGDAAISWAFLLVAAPFQRYLIGTVLVDTNGSTLAAGIVHAAVNAAGAMTVIPGGWQHVPALIVLTPPVAARRTHLGPSPTQGSRQPSRNECRSGRQPHHQLIGKKELK